MKLKLTKSAVDKIPLVKDGRKTYTDTNLKGFGVRVGKVKKVYYAEKRIDGRTVRANIGEHGQINTEQARDKAQVFLGQMTEGINPVEIKRQSRFKHITLLTAFDEYLHARKALKPSTTNSYRKIMRGYFSDWHSKPLNLITKEMVIKRHEKMGDENGHAQANLSMRLLRAIFNFAEGRYEKPNGEPLLAINPVKVLSQSRAWFKVSRRRTFIKPDELPKLFKALNEIVKEGDTSMTGTIRDYLLLLLFTGLRKQEALEIRWEDVDLISKNITLIKTKNSEPLTLPLSTFLFTLLTRRNKYKTNEYVFSGTGKAGHLVEPKKLLNRIRELSGLSFMIHDLRRTYATVAGNIVSAYVLKALLNHKMDGTSNDVTAGYFVQDAETLRPAVQKIANKILQHARRTSSKVVNLHSR